MKISEYRSIVAVLLLSTILLGCSTGRAYLPRDSIWGLGYSDTQLATNSWRVSYKGYEIPEDKAADFALYRAAQICQSAGFKYFSVDESRETSASKSMGYAYAGTGYAMSAQYPNASLTIHGYKEKPEENIKVYETEFVAKSIKAKYSIKD